MATQRNVHWHSYCMHALKSCIIIAPAYTKLASLAARTANYDTAHHPHTMRASCRTVNAVSMLIHMILDHFAPSHNYYVSIIL